MHITLILENSVFLLADNEGNRVALGKFQCKESHKDYKRIKYRLTYSIFHPEVIERRIR